MLLYIYFYAEVLIHTKIKSRENKFLSFILSILKSVTQIFSYQNNKSSTFLTWYQTYFKRKIQVIICNVIKFSFPITYGGEQRSTPELELLIQTIFLCELTVGKPSVRT